MKSISHSSLAFHVNETASYETNDAFHVTNMYFENT